MEIRNNLYVFFVASRWIPAPTSRAFFSASRPALMWLGLRAMVRLYVGILNCVTTGDLKKKFVITILK